MSSQDILVIEGHPKLREVIAGYLGKGGYKVTGAEDGPQGLVQFARGDFGCLIVDMHPPKLPGEVLLQKVRQTPKGRSVPVIAMSGQLKTPEQFGPLVKKLGINAFLPKPFDFKQLWATTVRLIGKPEATAKTGAEAPRDFKGSLERTPLHKLLKHLFDNSLSGLLTITSGNLGRAAFVSDGLPIVVEDKKGLVSFGNYLNSSGRLTMEEQFIFEEVCEKSRSAAQHLLVQMGVLTPSSLFFEMQKYFEELLVEAFEWHTGEFTFAHKEPPFKYPVSESLNIFEVINRGLRTSLEKKDVGEFFSQHQGKYIGIGAGLYRHQYYLNLSPLERDLLGQINGKRMLRELATGKGIDTEEALRAAYIFQVLEMITLETAPIQKLLEPEFPIRETPAVLAEEIGYVRVKVEDLIDGKFSTTVQFGEMPEPPMPESAAQLAAAPAQPDAPAAGGGFSNMLDDLADDLADLGDSLELPDAPVSLGAIGTAVPQQAPGDSASDKRVLSMYDKIVNSKNFYEVFDMKPNNFSFNDMKKRYHELVNEFSPEKFIMSSTEVMAKAEEILSKVAKAFNTLSNVVTKEAYDETIKSQRMQSSGSKFAGKKLQIDVSFNSGMAFLADKDYSAAEQAFREVLEMDPGNASAKAHLAWAAYAHPARRNKKGPQQTCIRDLNNVLKSDMRNAYAYAYKGQVLFEADQAALAEVELKKALAINAGLKDAARTLQLITAKKDDDKKGFFGRLVT